MYWSDGLGGRAFDHRSRRGAEHLPTKIARMAGHLTISSNARGLPGGGGCSRLELTDTLIGKSEIEMVI